MSLSFHIKFFVKLFIFDEMTALGTRFWKTIYLITKRINTTRYDGSWRTENHEKDSIDWDFYYGERVRPDSREVA